MSKAHVLSWVTRKVDEIRVVDPSPLFIVTDFCVLRIAENHILIKSQYDVVIISWEWLNRSIVTQLKEQTFYIHIPSLDPGFPRAIDLEELLLLYYLIYVSEKYSWGLIIMV